MTFSYLISHIALGHLTKWVVKTTLTLNIFLNVTMVILRPSKTSTFSVISPRACYWLIDCNKIMNQS